MNEQRLLQTTQPVWAELAIAAVGWGFVIYTWRRSGGG
jgi:hypothetical protein